MRNGHTIVSYFTARGPRPCCDGLATGRAAAWLGRGPVLEGRGLDEDLALDELCRLGLKDLLPPTREARVESFMDDCIVLNIAYL